MQSNALRLVTQTCKTRCALLYLPLLYMLEALSYTPTPHTLTLNIHCLRERAAVPEQEVSALMALEGREMHVLLEAAGAVRDAGHRIITFSPKVASQPLSAYQLYAQEFSKGSGCWLRRPGVLAAHAALP